MKLLLSFIICISNLVVIAQTQEHNQDSLLYLKVKTEFTSYEKEHGHYIETNNVRMHYLTWGKPSGIPIVWLHGTMSNAYEFYGYADSLTDLGYYVIAIDYYGHGFTPIPDKEISLYHVADDIRFLLDHLSIKKIIIGGWSRGGSIATAFYDAYPYRVSAIILEDGGSVAWATIDQRKAIDSFSFHVRKDFKEYEKYLNLQYRSEFEALKESADLNNRARVFHALAKIKKNDTGIWVVNPGTEHLTGENSADEFLNLFYRPFASSKLFGASTLLVYPKVIYRNLHVPMLILDPVSKNDNFAFEVENAKLQKAHPQWITHNVYDNTHHGLKFQHPVQFLKDIKSFLSSVKY